MGYTGPIPEHFLRLMRPKERPSGPAGLTLEEAEEAGEISLEVRDVHAPILAWLDFHQIPYVYHRTDRRSGIRQGWPDFTVLWQGKGVCIEAKRPGGKLSKKQEEVAAALNQAGISLLVTSDPNAAISFVKQMLEFTP